jgi:mannose-1-phosphate guanylyltransferase / mannose-6-phosphate isomerase
MRLIPVILSGGSGTRLWPLSREELPKQYLSLAGEKTMLQETILRLNGLKLLSDPVIVCNSEHRFLVKEQCSQIDLLNPTILLEPVGRNTAPAITAAALFSLRDVGDSLLLVLSADHLIEDIEAFHKAITNAIEEALQDKLVTFGIIPSHANTGYGYIEYSKNKSAKAFKVNEFTEKPNLDKAESFLEQGNFLWNSGMFVFKSSALINELNIYSPEIFNYVTSAVEKSEIDLNFIRLSKESFTASPSISIDYAVLEKSKNVVVVPLDAKWNDIGSWEALYEVGKKDSEGNVIIGDVYARDTVNTYINAKNHIVVVNGLDNLVVIDTPDATLVSSKEKAQEVDGVVKFLKDSGREESSANRKVYRPWGWYDSIETGTHYKVKRLHIKPKAKLSLQLHQQRAEHWIVVKGIASVINGEEELLLKEGESTYVPKGIKHAIENSTDNPVEIIEVQSGTYLGEDDIIRFEDIYGRTNK